MVGNHSALYFPPDLAVFRPRRRGPPKLPESRVAPSGHPWPHMDPGQLRADARSIFEAGLRAADAESAVSRHLRLEGDNLMVGGRPWPLEDPARRVRVVGMGKASAAMALSVEKLLGPRIDSGLVVVKDGHGRPLEKIRVLEAGHPIPDHRGLRGADTLLGELEDLEEGDLAICLVSGGGSALTPAPVAGTTLGGKQEVTRLLLASGATIHQINTLRKHLSRIKGGQLARHAFPGSVVTLALSDVVGDDLDTIASGPTVPDRSTFADCIDILESRGLSHLVPSPILSHLQAGARGGRTETPKGDHPAFARGQNLIVGNNQMALEAAGEMAKALGYQVAFPDSLEEGEARDLASSHLAVARSFRREESVGSPPLCILTGGEATVTIRGTGKGGRNQEFVLAAALALEGTEGVVVLSAGTDGTDGPTDAAGAICDGATSQRGRALGLDPELHLTANDSYNFFQPLGDLVKTGPTFTNVLDLRIVLVA